eukprot:scaffold1591_cov208-Alexandrium_tamarense.AAC.6
MTGNINTAADGYSRTDQHIPIATSAQPPAPPLESEYNDGRFDGNGAGGDASDTASQTSLGRHLPHPDRPTLEKTHEGEHRYDHGDLITDMNITRALNSCNLGYDIGVNTGAGKLVQDSLNLSNFQLEMFMGSLNLFAMVGALSSNWISDKLGRRWAFRVAAIGFIFGMVVQSGAGGYGSLMFGRAFVGLGVGFGLAVDPVYISEISQAAHRGHCDLEIHLFSTTNTTTSKTNVGICLGFVSGLVFSSVDENIAWRLMFSMGVIMPCFVIYLATTVMPESPRWLVSKGREAEAQEVLKKVYPDGYDVGVIVSEIHDGIEKEAIAEHAIGWNVIFFPTPAFKRMLLVGVGTAVAQQAAGVDCIGYFLVYILDESGIKSRNAQMWILIVLGLIKLVVIVLAGHLFDRKGRRPLFFVSLLGMSVALFLVSFSFMGDGSRKVLSVFGLALYLSFFSVGMGPGAWLIPSEVFSTMIRAKAMSVA